MLREFVLVGEEETRRDECFVREKKKNLHSRGLDIWHSLHIWRACLPRQIREEEIGRAEDLGKPGPKG